MISQHDSTRHEGTQNHRAIAKIWLGIAICAGLIACSSSSTNNRHQAGEELAPVPLAAVVTEGAPPPPAMKQNSRPQIVLNTVVPMAPPQYIPPAEIVVEAPPPAEPQVRPLNAPVLKETDIATPSDTAKYSEIKENPWKLVSEQAVSTFSADVDTGSYANVRRFLQYGQLPVVDAVRTEELVNYFGYVYGGPSAKDAHPFRVHTQVASSPWNKDRQLIRIAIKGKDLAKETLPAANLVFLVDVSGSMSPNDRLPLVKAGLKLLTMQLRAQDRVSLVTYADGTRVVLPSTSGDKKDKIIAAIDQLVSSGSTNGEAGIRLAYAQAHAGMIKGGINRVLLATDGDLNVGQTDPKQLQTWIERERKAGISLSTLGVGDDNYNEALMKQLADNGDGSYHYLDSLQEAHKVLVNEFTSTLSVIAKDLKLQVEFNPAYVDEYRLIGYELRGLTREQFNDDMVDAGDIGSGHTVTALYEIVPKGGKGHVDPLRYRTSPKPSASDDSNKHRGELAWLKMRYKTAGSDTSTLVEYPIQQPAMLLSINATDSDFRFAAAVAAWGQWLRGSKQIGSFNPKGILALAKEARGNDPYGHRAEFLRLVELSATLKHQESGAHVDAN